MKKVLILYPHFPPSNLAGVHRPRLFANHLKKFGWEPIVLTVKEEFYEEAPDFQLSKLLPPDLRIEKVNAFRVTKPRLIGDIGLRAFFQLFKKAVDIIRTEQIDFLYVSIPSFYGALVARLIHGSTGVLYGVDYIDPWVHEFPGANKIFSRHWFSSKLAKFLEPIAVSKAALITGVAEGYYKPVLERNPTVQRNAIVGAMPYGGEQSDHDIMYGLEIEPYLFLKNKKFQLVYAGAMLPKAYIPLEKIFSVISRERVRYEDVEFHFIGTGKTPLDTRGFNIKPLAEKYGLWQTLVFEYPARIPYLDVLTHLNAAKGVFILGSTEPHYTPSKTYQGVMSGKPLFCVLHAESTAVDVVESSGAGIVLSFKGEDDVNSIETGFSSYFERYRFFASQFDPVKVDKAHFGKYSAEEITATLAKLLDQVYYKKNHAQ